MKNSFIIALLTTLFLFSFNLNAEVFLVNSLSQFNTAQNNAVANDSILWESGTFTDIYMIITKDNLYVGASELGGTIFNGESKVKIDGDYTTFEGFQYIGGDIGTRHIVDIFGDHNHITQLNLKDYTGYKYLVIRDETQYNRVTYCNFENRLNLDDQNILSILVDETEPGYHKIQYCSFKNFDGNGADDGIEPIRIGLSTQASFISRDLVEYCYFTECDGDGEIISSKATEIVYRFNTFESNTKAELVLRHGSKAIVYGNFFLNNRGGVRVREGQNHFIYNNYFDGNFNRAIFLQNDEADPVADVNIAFNTIVNCGEIRLGGSGGDFNPTNITFSNNIISASQDEVFDDPTGTETWIGNIINGDVGNLTPSNGLLVADPLLVQNGNGYNELSANSPAIDAAQSGYLPMAQYDGMDPIDSDILLDLMGNIRPSTIAQKDVGCTEFPPTIPIQPYATDENTGPSYETDFINNTNELKPIIESILQLSPNPVLNQIDLSLKIPQTAVIKINIVDLKGSVHSTLFNQKVAVGKQRITRDLSGIAPGVYMLSVQVVGIGMDSQVVQSVKFVKI